MKNAITILFLFISLTGCTVPSSGVVNELDAGDNSTQKQAKKTVPSPQEPNKNDINLSDKNIEKFPINETKNKKATILNLSNNKLKSLPSEIGNLENIEEFYVDHNLLEGALPAEIRKMKKLKILDASNNNLTGIPAEIGQLEKLEILDLSNNNIDTIPMEIYNLKDLKTLDISGNKYSQEQIEALMTGLPKTNIIK